MLQIKLPGAEIHSIRIIIFVVLHFRSLGIFLVATVGFLMIPWSCTLTAVGLCSIFMAVVVLLQPLAGSFLVISSVDSCP